MVVCPKCGMENEVGVEECIVCSTPLETKQVNIVQTKKDNTISNILIIIGVLVLIISFSVLIYSFLSK